MPAGHLLRRDPRPALPPGRLLEAITGLRPALLLEDHADQGTLASLKHVRIRKGDPEAL